MLWGLDRATFRKASTATGARVIRSGGIMSVGIDTNADGKIDTVLSDLADRAGAGHQAVKVLVRP